MKRDRAIREAIGMDTKAGTAACAGACMQQRTGVGVADGAAVVRSNVGDAALAKLHAADLAQLVARLLTGDAVHHKAALGVIHQADGRGGQGGRGQGLCCSTCCGAWRWQCMYIRACACPSTATGAFPAAQHSHWDVPTTSQGCRMPAATCRMCCYNSPEELAGLLQLNDIHEAGGVRRIRADLAVNLDEALHENHLDLLAGQRIPGCVAAEWGGSRAAAEHMSSQRNSLVGRSSRSHGDQDYFKACDVRSERSTRT